MIGGNMKKVMLLLGFFLLMTGCKKTLMCSLDTESTDVNTKQVYKIYYNNGNIKNVDYDIIYDLLNKNLRSDYDMMTIFMRGNLEENNVNYDYKYEDNKYILTAHYDVESMSYEAINQFIGTKNFKDFKKNLKQQGFICK